MYLFIHLFGFLIDGWVKRCNYRNGRCRQSCKENERKKEKCGENKICCIPDVKCEPSYSVEEQQMTYEAKVRTAEHL
ncbi:unnamed protein product [Gulo gulo]|uniref:Beta-defensin n=1 Tax=Gulo gulo TaxID=48420 RepID=A0A9X9M5C4_GULGU|nr:unnamed protein product [Gulo gulo]